MKNQLGIANDGRCEMNNYTFPDTEGYKVHKFSELLSRLQNMFDSVRNENSELYKKLSEFNSDDD